MATKTTSNQQLVGTANHETRFARILSAAGDDPSSLMLMISMMERIAHEPTPRRRKKKSTQPY